MKPLKEQLRDRFDLIEHLSALSYLELTDLAIQMAERLYEYEDLYVTYEVPEEYDLDEPASFYLRWTSTGEDVVDSVIGQL